MWEWTTSISTESSMSLSPAVSPSFCSLRISSGLLYGLRANRCVTLSLSGLSCMSPTPFLFEAQALFFGLNVPNPFLMLLRRGWDERWGFVRLARAGAGARTVTFLPVREQEITRQNFKSTSHIKAKISSKEILWRFTGVCQRFPSSEGELLWVVAFVFFIPNTLQVKESNYLF